MHGCRQHLPRTLRHEVDAAQWDDRACEPGPSSGLAGTDNRVVSGNMHNIITLGPVQLDQITRR